MTTMYTVSEMIGNFSEIVYRSEFWYDVQEYLENRLNESDTDPEDESAVELFYSYFSIESVSADYDYREAETADIVEYIKDEIDLDDFDDIDELREKLCDVLWIEDGVTGNGSGSYYCNSYKAQKSLAGNLDLLAEALEEFGCTDNAFEYIRDAEKADVTIRCYILGECIEKALEELDIEAEFELRVLMENRPFIMPKVVTA